MTPSPNRLLNITLHDSYFKGLRTKLLCDGHTNNTGGNGAGKTSALQLIPIFYGCQPNQVMSRVADKKGFLDYYLPRNQSLIVFEYTRPDGICCAILFRNPTNQLNYCFIKASADEGIFSPQLQWAFDNSLSSTEIIKELRNLKIEMSKLRTTTDYASIIGKTKRIAKDSSLMTEASQFSLSNTKMTYMGDLTNVLLSETQLLKKLKTMLAETLLSGIKLLKTPVHTQNESLLDSFEMLSRLDTITADMSTAKDLLDTIRHDKSQLFIYQSDLYHYNDEFHQHKAKIIDKKEKNLQEKQLNFEDYNVKKAEIAGQITVLESQLNAHKKQLDKIGIEETSYQKSQIDSKIADYDKLPQHRATLENLQKDLNFASQSANSIIEQFKRQQLAVKQDFNEQLQILNHKFSQVQEKNRTDSQALNTHIQTLSEQEKSERQVLTDSQHQEANYLKDSIHQHELQREQAKHLTPEEQDILQTYSEQEASLGEQIAQFERDKIEQSQQKQHNQQQLHTLSKEFDDFSAKIEALATQQSELHDSLYSDGTLLAFLRDSRHDNASNWHTIAKVIDPALFMSKNLNPVWNSEPSPTQSHAEKDFYGLIIDTENLPLPKQAEDTELLQTQLQQVSDKITHLKKQLEYKEKQIFDTQQTLKEITAHESISMSNISDLDKQRKIFTQETQAKRQAFAENAQQRQADITEQIEALKNQQSQLQLNHQRQIDEFNQRFEQKQQTLQQKQNDLNNSVQQAKQQFELSRNKRLLRAINNAVFTPSQLPVTKP